MGGDCSGIVTAATTIDHLVKLRLTSLANLGFLIVPALLVSVLNNDPLPDQDDGRPVPKLCYRFPLYIAPSVA
jgi:hypothetical protein